MEMLKQEQKEKDKLFSHFFSKKDVHPYDEVKWVSRRAFIEGGDGKVVFEQNNVEVPDFWSESATNILSSKYFRGILNSPQREKSLKQVIDRIVNTITAWGLKDDYFNFEESETFKKELTFLLLHQYAAFNSPVYFNVGFEQNPQCSACFILSVEDDIRSILELVKNEAMIFKYGSGSGVNLSNLRSSREHLTGGGWSSGPVSFMKPMDSMAGVIRSGGKTRRAAKMVILNIDHPDIEDFVKSKVVEEKKAMALINAGYDGSMDGEAYSSVYFQNANNSVRVTDDFMRSVESGGEWSTKFVKTGEVFKTYKAVYLMRMIAEAAHDCGDPGLQFDTTINEWNTCKQSGKINASNPCSEFMFLDNTSCNLASLNLIKFLKDDYFDVESFKNAVKTILTAQEIIVDNASYPTKEMTENSKKFRPLGIGYSNAGGILMKLGLPYDSDDGRNYIAAITSLMTGYSYLVSSKIAERKKPFSEYEKNKESFIQVIIKHLEHAKKLKSNSFDEKLFQEALHVWNEAYQNGLKNGFRNAQVSLLAPTGTISFLMDCQTTGIEPEIALVKYKWLVGGGVIKTANEMVPQALEKLGYSQSEIERITDYLKEKGTIEGAQYLKAEHLPVFDCAFKAQNGKRSIHWSGHVKMLAAIQPFLSGSISKTVNMDNTSTVDDVMDVYMSAWRLGLKSIAIYRDGSKSLQPLTTTIKTQTKRRKLGEERTSITHKFVISGHEGYLTVGLYEDGSPGELFVTMSRQGSTIAGLMDSFAVNFSIALQHGVPLKTLVSKMIYTRFEPAGITNNKNIRFSTSIIDYIGRWLALKFLTEDELEEIGVKEHGEQKTLDEKTANIDESQVKITREPVNSASSEQKEKTTGFVNQLDAPLCPNCGMVMVRNGSCYKCLNCGATSGCS
jgi:ribonucleoside-diphosphate reductase alpha chain